MKRNSQHPETLVARMESLADMTRLRLLRVLERHELGVAELCKVLQMPQSTVSRHLKVLADDAWTRNRRQGTANLYRMDVDELDATARALRDVARDQFNGSATLKQDDARLSRLLESHQADTRKFFTGAATEWDELRTRLYGRSFTQSAMLGLLPADWTVADLGCGTGEIAAALSPHVGKVIAIDATAAMVKAAKARTSGMKNVDVREADLTALPIRKNECDAALTVLTLTYIPDPIVALREMHRVVKPGGRAVVVDLMAHEREDFRREMGQVALGFEPGELEKMLGKAGFAKTQVITLPPDPDAMGPALLLATTNKP